MRHSKPGAWFQRVAICSRCDLCYRRAVFHHLRGGLDLLLCRPHLNRLTKGGISGRMRFQLMTVKLDGSQASA